MYFVGMDTSNYTTSLAVVDDHGHRILDRRIPLVVAKGERGLRQQEAVFQHLRNLSALVEGFEGFSQQIHTVASSVKPRMMESSYMPVFEVSKSMGQFLAGMTGARFFPTSHQRGHLRVALEGLKITQCHFVGFHLSGGTTEILEAFYEDGLLEERCLGGTSDISAGQLIDRMGVKLGFPFPAGKAMDASLQEERMDVYEKSYRYKGFFHEGTMNLSGLENHLTQRLEQGSSSDEIVYATFRNIAQVIEKAALYYTKEVGVSTVLFTGGVSANRFIRNYLNQILCQSGLKVLFCPKEDCTDNAVGVALMGLDQYRRSIK